MPAPHMLVSEGRKLANGYCRRKRTVSGFTTWTLEISAKSATAPWLAFNRRSNVNLTAAAFTGEPSWNLTLGRRWKVQVLPSGDCCQLVARSGTIVDLCGPTARTRPSYTLPR